MGSGSGSLPHVARKVSHRAPSAGPASLQEDGFSLVQSTVGKPRRCAAATRSCGAGRQTTGVATSGAADLFTSLTRLDTSIIMES